jgi:pimeloyl-ACP methyl ester carboxylesterase
VTIELSRRHLLGLAVGVPLAIGGHAWGAQRSIDESCFVSIGGIDQWLAIQGGNAMNPAILFLHGGPANSQSPFLAEFRPWEQQFTVANWDQRGSGKTYGKNGPSTPGMSTPKMALDRLTADAIEVAAHVCRRLSKRKIILVGHSWGAILGLHVIKRRPDLFHAFVATGLPVSWKHSLEELEHSARQQATSAGDETTLKALDDAAHLPIDDMRRINATNKYRMTAADQEYLSKQQAFVGPPPLPTKGDVADWVGGRSFTGQKLLPVIVSFDPRTLGLDFSLPFFAIQGRDDHVVSFREAKKYVEEIQAPRKAFVPILGGHFACFTNSDAFIRALDRYVRPLAQPDIGNTQNTPS